MTQKEMLIEFITQSINDLSCASCVSPEDNCYVCLPKHQANHLLSNGVTVIPCKIGDPVWCVRNSKGTKYASQGIASQIYFNDRMEIVIVVKNIARGVFGKMVFLTKEDAERAIEEGKR